MIQTGLKVKQAAGFSTHFLGQCVPKNALYFRWDSTVVYCSDFGQFARQKVVDVYIMDIKKHGHFKKELIRKDNPIARVFEREIQNRGISGVKCENVMCIKRAGEIPVMRLPKLRQERMKPDACYTITDGNLEKERGSFVAASIMRDYNYLR